MIKECMIRNPSTVMQKRQYQITCQNHDGVIRYNRFFLWMRITPLMSTRPSRTGILVYLNRAPILWYTKRQNSVDTSTFGSEFMATKTAVEIIKGLRYKLLRFPQSLAVSFSPCSSEGTAQKGRIENT
jgi:hypothetical protein